MGWEGEWGGERERERERVEKEEGRGKDGGLMKD